tara:strand:- start:1608 stop:2477 length:870 start_codon:yes stop_codon:yes gene_type:complete
MPDVKRKEGNPKMTPAMQSLHQLLAKIQNDKRNSEVDYDKNLFSQPSTTSADSKLKMYNGGNIPLKNNNMKLKYRQGANMQRLAGLVKKFQNGETFDFGDGTLNEKIKGGLASSAALGTGYEQGTSINIPEDGSTGIYNQFLAEYQAENPNLFDPKLQQHSINNEKVYYPNTAEGQKQFVKDYKKQTDAGGNYVEHSTKYDYGEEMHDPMAAKFDEWITGASGGEVDLYGNHTGPWSIVNKTPKEVKHLRDKYMQLVNQRRKEMGRDHMTFTDAQREEYRTGKNTYSIQ